MEIVTPNNNIRLYGFREVIISRRSKKKKKDNGSSTFGGRLIVKSTVKNIPENLDKNSKSRKINLKYIHNSFLNECRSPFDWFGYFRFDVHFFLLDEAYSQIDNIFCQIYSIFFLIYICIEMRLDFHYSLFATVLVVTRFENICDSTGSFQIRLFFSRGLELLPLRCDWNLCIADRVLPMPAWMSFSEVLTYCYQVVNDFFRNEP